MLLFFNVVAIYLLLHPLLSFSFDVRCKYSRSGLNFLFYNSHCRSFKECPAMSNDNDIDPLQFLKQNGKIKVKPELTTRNSPPIRNSSVNSTDMAPESMILDTTSIGIDEVLSRIEFREVSLLSNLPYEVYFTFISYCRQYVPRISVTAATFHLMMLVPTLKYLKSHTEISILPFLYLGPIVFAIPYIALFLWENNIVTIPFIEVKMKQFIYALKERAKIKMEEVGVESTSINTREQVSYTPSEYLDKIISQRALVQLLTKIDVDALASEVLAFSKSKNKIGAVESYTSGAARSSGSVVEAVQALLSALEVSGSKQDALEKLKELQRELDDNSERRNEK